MFSIAAASSRPLRLCISTVYDRPHAGSCSSHYAAKSSGPTAGAGLNSGVVPPELTANDLGGRRHRWLDGVDRAVDVEVPIGVRPLSR